MWSVFGIEGGLSTGRRIWCRMAPAGRWRTFGPVCTQPRVSLHLPWIMERLGFQPTGLQQFIRLGMDVEWVLIAVQFAVLQQFIRFKVGVKWVLIAVHSAALHPPILGSDEPR